MLKELILEGQNRYYDCEVCEGLTVTPEDIERFCAEMKATAIRNTLTEGEKLKVRDVTRNVLISWGVLAERDGAVVPTNAYALLTGQARFQPVIQCAVFKGKDRAYFVDRREFEGPIQDQMEAAFQYVLEKINRGMRIQGMYRQDMYELPVDSVREMIANSVTHRSYLEPGNIQVALYDDRLEVTSPGMLLNGVSIRKMKEGYSKPRNRAIASAFAYMKIVFSSLCFCFLFSVFPVPRFRLFAFPVVPVPRFRLFAFAAVLFSVSGFSLFRSPVPCFCLFGFAVPASRKSTRVTCP